MLDEGRACTQLRTLLDVEAARPRSLWAIKDPRCSRLLPLWIALARELAHHAQHERLHVRLPLRGWQQHLLGRRAERHRLPTKQARRLNDLGAARGQDVGEDFCRLHRAIR